VKARRIFGWFKRRLLGRTIRPRTVFTGAFRNLKFLLDPNHQSQLLLGLHERETHRWLPKLVEGCDSAIDIGTAEGEYAIYFLKRCNLQKVFTFDPDDASRERFQQNLALNELTDDGQLFQSPLAVRQTPDTGSTTLDELLPELPLPCCIKIDVDGGEAEILMGAKRLLQMHHCRWLIETHSIELERDCVRILEMAGYRTTIIKNAWWRIFVPEQRPIPHNRWLVAFPERTA